MGAIFLTFTFIFKENPRQRINLIIFLKTKPANLCNQDIVGLSISINRERFIRPVLPYPSGGRGAAHQQIG
jgi:hypothetical protein